MDNTRRNFIKKTALGTAAITTLSPNIMIGKNILGANDRIHCAIAGIRSRGKAHAAAINLHDNAKILFNCDVDDTIIEEHNKWCNENIGYVPKVEKDYRKLLENKDIDVIFIATPEHWHTPMTIMAMQNGKHVYVEKPCSHNPYENELLVAAQKKYGLKVQMGNQQRSAITSINAINDIRNGIIGKVYKGEAYYSNNRGSIGKGKTTPIPKSLDWDLWQGPVKRQDYSADYVPVKWRGWWKYGCGALGDIGCHTFDAPFWALGLGSPTKVEIERKDPPGKGFIPMGSVVTYHFAARGKKPPVTLKWYEKGYEVPKPTRWQKDKDLPSGGGMYMEGTKETLYHSGMRPNSPMVTPGERFMEMKSELVKIPKLPSVGNGPIEEWYRAIKGDGPMPGSNFDYAAPLTEMVLLGALAQRTGKNIEWDSKKMKVKGQPEFDALIKEPARKGWQYGENFS
jgi:predicted dehydrogenase